MLNRSARLREGTVPQCKQLLVAELLRPLYLAALVTARACKSSAVLHAELETTI